MLIKLKYFEFLTRSCDPRPTLGNLRMAILAQPHNKQWQNIIEAFVLKLLIKTHLALSLSRQDVYFNQGVSIYNGVWAVKSHPGTH